MHQPASFKALLERAGLPDVRFQDLCHSCGSLLAAQGVPARVAMDVLGHASIQITQNICTHVFDYARRQAAAVTYSLFGDTNEGLYEFGLKNVHGDAIFKLGMTMREELPACIETFRPFLSRSQS